MSTYHFLFAVALLTTPPDALELSESEKLHNALGPAVRSLALQLEVLDPREVSNLLAAPKEFINDLKVLQGRYQDLASAPSMTECDRLPSLEMAKDLTAFNRAYRNTLTNRLELDVVHAEELRAAVQETDYLYHVWDLVRDARCEYYYITYRRQALKRLRELVGEQAFYSGTLPPCVPMWRIPIIDN